MPDITLEITESQPIELNFGHGAVGVPPGGNDGQVLAKASNADYDTEWINGGGGGGSSTWGGITGTLSNQTDLQSALDALQPLDAELTAIAGLTSAADKAPYFTGSGTAALFDITAAGRAILDDADASAQRTTLGLGTLATQNGTFSGTSSGTNTGDQTITLTGDVTGSGTGSFAATIASGAVTLAKMADVGTSTIFYRKTSGTGAPEVQPLSTLKSDLELGGTNSGDVTLSGENYLSLSGQALTAGAVNLSGTHVTGTLAAARFGALTGDVTNTAGSYATTIAANAVTYAKIQKVASNNVLLGNDNGTTQDVQELTASEVKAMLSLDNVENTALSTWAGSANITTLGTVGTGTWNATAIGVTKGGTGLTALGSALQQLRVNSGGTALEYFTPSGGGTWGSITGTLSAQTDLQSALDAKQPIDAELTAIAGLTSAADKLPYFTGSGTAGLADFTAAGRALLDDVDASAQRTTLGLGTLATQSGTFSGTSSGTNTGDQTITLTGDVTGSGTGSFAATIANDAVTYAKFQNASSDNVLLGNLDGANAAFQELSATDVRVLLSISNVENTALSTWAGSTNLTTLGTIGTGTWNATAIGITKGGTGLTSLGTALQQLRVNAGATALEYFTPSASGDILNGGNTTGAQVTIGTNDNNALAFETNGVERLSISSGTSTGGVVTQTVVTANTSTVQDALIIRANSTGTAAAGFGGGILFQGESSTTDNRDMVSTQAYWVTGTDASRASGYKIRLLNGSQTLADHFVFTNGGGNSGSLLIGTTNGVDIRSHSITTQQAFTVGNSSSALTLGGSSGAVTISNTSTNSIAISNTVNAATSTAGIRIGQITFTQTSGTRNYVDYNSNFAPTSGTAVHNQFTFSGTFNQTGGANGITRGIYLNQTLTAVADFRGIEIAYSNSSAKGIYQTGSSTTNNFAGGTTFGATSAPDATAAIDVTSTTKGVLFPRMTETQRDAISSPPNGLVLYNTTTDKLQVRAAGAWADLN